MVVPNKKPTVLICDDEEGIRESFKLILSDNYHLKFVNNGLQAIDLLKTFTPDAMLLDYSGSGKLDQKPGLNKI